MKQYTGMRNGSETTLKQTTHFAMEPYQLCSKMRRLNGITLAIRQRTVMKEPQNGTTQQSIRTMQYDEIP